MRSRPSLSGLRPSSPLVVAPADRAAFINALLGRRYLRGGDGPEAFDCYGLTRLLQAAVYGRDMPPFLMPRGAGRFAIASAIAAHPERELWQPVARPVDGAIAIMARQGCGFHMGTCIVLDGSLASRSGLRPSSPLATTVVVHALEEPGVVADDPFRLATPGGGLWRIAWNDRAALAEAVAA